MTTACGICGDAHSYLKCPEPILSPSSEQKPDEDDRKYHRRLRHNAYMAKWQRDHPEVKARRNEALKVSRMTNGAAAQKERARLRRLRERRNEEHAEIKNRPCLDCGGTFPSCVMQFDHRDPTTKNRQYRSFGDMRGSKRVYAEEIAKCDLVCANCHAIRTHITRRVTVGLGVNVPRAFGEDERAVRAGHQNALVKR